ncbi:MAG: hypothetical protein WCC69_11875 [Pirellulales bacterium]
MPRISETATPVAEPGRTVVIRDGGVQIGTVDTQKNGRWTFVVPHLAAGSTNTFTAVALGETGIPGPFSQAYRVTIDTTAPVVERVTSSLADGTYRVGQIVDIQVAFTEAVFVSGVPVLRMNTNTSRTARYVAGSGTSTLTFRFTVKRGDFARHLDVVTTGSLDLDGGSIRDLAGNAASLRLPKPGSANSLRGSKTIVVDGRESLAFARVFGRS